MSPQSKVIDLNGCNNNNNNEKKTSKSVDSTTRTFYLASVVPNIILKYVQLMLNIAIIGLLIYGALCAWEVIKEDLERHMAQQRIVNAENVMQCYKDYTRNDCESLSHIPALDAICAEWKICMEKDPNTMLRTQESVAMAAECLNRFFETISTRTLFAGTIMSFSATLLLNLTLGLAKF